MGRRKTFGIIDVEMSVGDGTEVRFAWEIERITEILVKPQESQSSNRRDKVVPNTCRTLTGINKNLSAKLIRPQLSARRTLPGNLE